METSAKTGFNVGNCLMNLVKYVYIHVAILNSSVTPPPPPTHRTIKVYYEQEGPERRERGIQVANKPKGSGCCGR